MKEKLKTIRKIQNVEVMNSDLEDCFLTILKDYVKKHALELDPRIEQAIQSAPRCFVVADDIFIDKDNFIEYKIFEFHNRIDKVENLLLGFIFVNDFVYIISAFPPSDLLGSAAENMVEKIQMFLKKKNFVC